MGVEGKAPLWLRVVLAALSVVVGFLVALQGGVNASLGECIGSPLYAAFVSFAGGAVLLALVHMAVAAYSKLPLCPRRKGPSEPLSAFGPSKVWHWSGGALGTCYVSTIAFVTPRNGFGLTFICLVAGQVLMSVVLDHRSKLQPFNWIRGVAVVTLVAGAVFFGVDTVSDVEGGAEVVLYIAMTLVAGMLLPIQSAINQRLAGGLASRLAPLASTLISFTVGGFFALLLAIGAAVVKPSTWETLKDDIGDTSAWQYMGGGLGLWLVVSGIIIPKFLTFALFSNAVVAGTVVSAVVFDATGLLRDGKQDVAATSGVGVGLVLLSLAILFKGSSGPKRRAVMQVPRAATRWQMLTGKSPESADAKATPSAEAPAGVPEEAGEDAAGVGV